MPNATAGAVTEPNYADIQGFILRGYTHPFSVHMLFKFSTAGGASVFFKPLIPYLRSAEHWVTKPEMMLNIGLTWNGINIVRNDLQAVNFPGAFVDGPAAPNPQISLCDTGASDPAKWWNKQFATGDIHCIVHAYALSDADMSAMVKIIVDAAAATKGDVTELLPMASGSKRIEQYPYLLNNTIHFGYRDSINEPALNPDPSPPNPTKEDLNNFLIGYNKQSLPYPVTGAEGEFALNGCYNAFRVLFQDVPAFDKFLDDNAPAIATKTGKTVEYAREWLMAKLNGRWRNGSPLVVNPDMPDPETAELTKISYAKDTNALRCPYAAHTRVVNPRDEAIAGGQPPHLIRRGVPYGAPVNERNKDEDRGLVGLFLCGSIPSQFQKIYSWINSVDFSSLFPYPPPQDALVANRALSGQTQVTSFSIPIPSASGIAGATGEIVINDLPQFVVTRGTAYFLLPGITTIKAIAGIKS